MYKLNVLGGCASSLPSSKTQVNVLHADANDYESFTASVSVLKHCKNFNLAWAVIDGDNQKDFEVMLNNIEEADVLLQASLVPGISHAEFEHRYYELFVFLEKNPQFHLRK